MQALKNAKAQQTMRLTEAREGKAVSKSKRITIADVDGYTEEERKMMDNPMSAAIHWKVAACESPPLCRFISRSGASRK